MCVIVLRQVGRVTTINMRMNAIAMRQVGRVIIVVSIVVSKVVCTVIEFLIVVRIGIVVFPIDVLIRAISISTLVTIPVLVV